MCGKCRDCKWMYSNETMDGLYICVNGLSENFGQYTGICSEDECEDCENAFYRFMGIGTDGGGYEKLDSEVTEQ